MLPPAWFATIMGVLDETLGNTVKIGIVAAIAVLLAFVPAASVGLPAPGVGLSYIDSRGCSISLQRLPSESDRVAVFDGGDPARPILLRDGLLVAFDASVERVPSSVLARAGLTPVRPIDRAGTTWLCRAAGPDQVLEASRALAVIEGVRWAVPDFSVPIDLHEAPGDPFWSAQWPVNPSGSFHDVNVIEAWSRTTGDPRVIVAIIDTGVDTFHPDLGADRFVAGDNYIEARQGPWPGDRAAAAHGTHCAGIIGALHNDIGIAGLCPGCSLAGYRFLTGLPGDEHVAELSNAAIALRQAADDGAWVISNSWGIYNVNKPKVDLVPIFEAARYAAENGGPDGQGALVVFSSGNQMGYDESTDTTFALNIAPDDLAALPGVLAVGAINPEGERQEYSQWGPELDLVAPGGAYAALEPQIVTLDTSGSTSGRGNGANKGDGQHYVSAGIGDVKKSGMPESDSSGLVTQYFNGTSSSAPFVSGAAALVWSADLLDGVRDLSASDVRRILLDTAAKVGPLPYPAGRNDEYGRGLVDVSAAVQAALDGGLAPADEVEQPMADAKVAEPSEPDPEQIGEMVRDAADTAAQMDQASDLAVDSANDVLNDSDASVSGSRGCSSASESGRNSILPILFLSMFALVVIRLTRRLPQCTKSVSKA